MTFKSIRVRLEMLRLSKDITTIHTFNKNGLPLLHVQYIESAKPIRITQASCQTTTSFKRLDDAASFILDLVS